MIKDAFLKYLLVLTIALLSCQSSKYIHTRQFDRVVNQLINASFQSDSLALKNTTDKLKSHYQNPEHAYLAYYYQGMGKWQFVIRQPGLNPRDTANIDVINEALWALGKSIELKKDFVEAYALSIYCYYVLNVLQPQKQLEFIKKITFLRKKGLDLDSKNPHVILVEAQDIFYKPVQFGGNQQRGIELYHKAIELFKFRSANEHPKWGLEVAYAWLGNAYFTLEQPENTKSQKVF